MVYRSDVLFAGHGVKKLEVDDVELVKLLDQLDDVSIGQSDARFRLLRRLELLLQFQQFVVHFWFFRSLCQDCGRVTERWLPSVWLAWPFFHLPLF